MLNTESANDARRKPVGKRTCVLCQLRGLCLPDHIDQNVIKSMERVIKPRLPVPRGTYLFRQGEPMTAYYFVRSGSVKSVVDDDYGRETVIGFLYPTDLIGAGSMQHATYSTSVVTLERSAVCRVSAAHLTDLWGDNEALMDSFLAKVANRIQTERHARIRLDHMNADQRVADFIIELSNRMAALGREPDDLTLPMSRYDIGSYLGLAPETVSRTLGRFADRGFVAVKGKSLQLFDRQALDELVHRHRGE
ncbi:MAG: Crp/Fnr family transcriptional regulator [Gammaproteobacteria bacterium]|jgi:CRP/FNR family transcriptional regulator